MAKRPLPSFLIFRDQQGNWTWNFAGPGGRILASSAQVYANSQGCVRAIKLLKGSSDTPVVGRQADVKAATGLRAATAPEAVAPKAQEKKGAAEAKPVAKTAAKKKA